MLIAICCLFISQPACATPPCLPRLLCSALPAALQMEPVFRQMIDEVGQGVYVPVTSFGDQCALQGADVVPAQEARRRL